MHTCTHKWCIEYIYRIAPNFRGLIFSWSSMFSWFIDFSWFWRVKSCTISCFKKIRGKNFRDWCEIHENHENIVSRIFGAIRYINTYTHLFFSHTTEYSHLVTQWVNLWHAGRKLNGQQHIMITLLHTHYSTSSVTLPSASSSITNLHSANTSCPDVLLLYTNNKIVIQ